MKKYSTLRKVFVTLMSFSLALSLIPAPPVYAEKENVQETETVDEIPAEVPEITVVKISTADELVALSEKCRLDSYSQNMKVELLNDIDISDSDFECIQVFSGIFDGQCHEIKGLDFGGEGYAEGFFRYVAEGAVIKDLKLSGTVESSYTDKYVGGICGVNRGTIKNCTFSGVVTGDISVGGIAGENTGTGVIESCRAYGSVLGTSRTGGICGENHGMIISSSNSSAVDADFDWITEQDEVGLEWILEAIETKEIRTVSCSDVGGISGYSDGMIISCTNVGTIGYQHSGYNIGGIVGRQSGLVMSSTNDGRVYGKKDVGGIVGQMEPVITVTDGESLRSNVEELHDLVDKLLDDVEKAENAVSSDFDSISTYTDEALDYGNNVADSLTDFADDNIDSGNELISRLDYVMEELEKITENLGNAIDREPQLSEDVRKLADTINFSDKMENENYNPGNHDRVSIVTGVGGDVSLSDLSPEKGDEVELTVTSDNGYALNRLTVKDVNGKAISTVNSGSSYSFVMPAENVICEAEFKYVGRFVPSSNAGGVIRTKTDDAGKLEELTVIPDNGYFFSEVYVDGVCVMNGASSSYGTVDVTDREYKLTLTNPIEPSGDAAVTTVFALSGDTLYNIRTASSQGGRFTLSDTQACAGDIITATVYEESGYKLDKSSFLAGSIPLSATGETNKYSFVMPAGDVLVSAVFDYIPDADTVIYTESEIGGTVTAFPIVGSNNYMITLIPEGGYKLRDSALLIYEGSTLKKTVTMSELTENLGSYSYTINSNDYVRPIRVFGAFETDVNVYDVRYLSACGGFATGYTQCESGTDLYFTVSCENGYRIKEVAVSENGSTNTIPCEQTSLTGEYKFTMPSGDVTVKCEFEPVNVIVESCPGGDAYYTEVGDNCRIIISPRRGYSVKAISVKDASGRNVPVNKYHSGADTYEFSTVGISLPAKVRIDFGISSDYQAVEDAKDKITDGADKLSVTMNEISDSVDRINDLIRDDDGNVKAVDDIMSDSALMEDILEEVSNLADELSDAGIYLSDIISGLSVITEIVPDYIEDSLSQGEKDADRILDDFDLISDDISKAQQEVSNMLSVLNAKDDIKIFGLPDDFGDNVDGLFDNLKNINQKLDDVSLHIDRYTDVIVDDMKAINDKTQDIFELLIDKLDVGEEDIKEREKALRGYDDVTAEEIENATAGKTEGCVNNARVEGDSNVGGICGSMGIDEEDPDDNAATAANFSLGEEYRSFIVIKDCCNNGYILCKKNDAGCICGYMGMGIIVGAKAYGSVHGDGDYVGGVCGESHGRISDSFSLCTLEGLTYVGGIAGLGREITGCRSLVIIGDNTARNGAIAGDIEISDSDEGLIQYDKVHDNYYVSDSLWGIDEISYIGMAEPVTYEQLISTEGIPKEYRHLKITFVVDGDELGSKEYRYGTALEDIEYPEIPYMEGCFGRWPKAEDMIMNGNIILEAEYFPIITTLQSTEGIEDNRLGNSDDGVIPYVLLDGVFDDSVSVHAKKVETDISGIKPDMSLISRIFRKNKAIEYTAVEIGLDGVNEDFSSRIRIYNPYGEKVSFYIMNRDGIFEKTDCKAYGKYLETQVNGKSATCLIINDEPGELNIAILIIAGGTVLLAVLLAVLISKFVLKKNRKNKESSGE